MKIISHWFPFTYFCGFPVNSKSLLIVDVILGLQWGDEGKGKIVDYFAPNYDVIARFQGGPNAGHTLYVDKEKIVLHQIPSGIFHENKINLIGNGVVLDAVTLKKECAEVDAMGFNCTKNLYISARAHLILPSHRALAVSYTHL